MIYSGKAITVQARDGGIAELNFDLQDESVNKFNALTINELKEATAAIAADTSLEGVIVTSGKPVFIVGADIMEFGALFGASEDEITDRILKINLEVFNAFEDLPIPTVAAINGIALGGGFEMGLVCDYRVMSETARIGLRNRHCVTARSTQSSHRSYCTRRPHRSCSSASTASWTTKRSGEKNRNR